MSTGFSTDDLATIAARSGGRCEVCGSSNPVHTHHRTPRRAGGTTGARAARVNAIPNALRLCHTCHDRIESERAKSYRLGYLVHDGDDPAAVPAYLATWFGRAWVTLNAWGGYDYANGPTRDEETITQ